MDTYSDLHITVLYQMQRLFIVDKIDLLQMLIKLI